MLVPSCDITLLLLQSLFKCLLPCIQTPAGEKIVTVNPFFFPLFFSVLFWNTLDRGMSDATLYGCCLCCILVHFFIFSQVDKEEVRLRRTIGLKKDEYFLDGKHITWVLNVVGEAPYSLIHHGCVYQHLALAVEWCSLNCITWFSGKPKLWIYWKVLGSLAQILTMLCSKERYLVTLLRNWIALFSFHFALRFMQHMLIFCDYVFPSLIISGLFHR